MTGPRIAPSRESLLVLLVALLVVVLGLMVTADPAGTPDHSPIVTPATVAPAVLYQEPDE